jgi:hypothetical protein
MLDEKDYLDCKGCKFYRLDGLLWLLGHGHDLAECTRVKKSRNFCSIERMAWKFLDVCGPNKKYFEVKK